MRRKTRMLKMTECVKSAMVLDGEISKHFDILQGALGCTLSPTLLKLFIDDPMIAMEAANRGVKVRGWTISGLTFADDFVGISKTLEGRRKQIEKALQCTRKCRVTSKVNKCAELAYSEDRKNTVGFK